MTAVPTEIDQTAPVIARHEIDIEAPLERVWHLRADVNSWPSWHNDITDAQLEGSLAFANVLEQKPELPRLPGRAGGPLQA